MALNLQQVQKQTQRLIMTPQMQQSIQLLQLTSIELEQLTEQELLENPFLTVEEEESGAASEDGAQAPPEPGAAENAPADEAGPAEPGAESGGDGAAETTVAESDALPEPNAPPERGEAPPDGGDDAPEWTQPTGADEAPEEFLSETATLEAAPERFEAVDVNWEEFFSDAESPVYYQTREDIEERDFSEYVAAKPTLCDHLNWQLRCSVLEGVEAEIGEYLIGSLNDDGYLAPEVVAEAAENFKIEPERVEKALRIVQEFDPPGIAARSLAECLLNQMKALGSYSELAREVLEDHMELFQKKKLRELARKLGVDEATLIALSQKIGRLEPHPGRSLTADSIQYITPDVYVKAVDGELMIYLNEGNTGRLSVDRFYQRMLREQKNSMTQKEREYSQEKFRSALTLIKNIEKRKSTILRVTEAIMQVQREFLDKGVEALKPLTLHEVADMVGMHESTVARVTSRKYVETPQGIYKLKFFFSSSIDSEGEDAVSSRAIKEKLHQIIAAEEPKRPLSDQKIADMLKKRGYDIARRTVAKYREQLKILPAKYRRKS